MARKTRGQGWEFIPARRDSKPRARTRSEPAEAQRISLREERRNRGKVVTVAAGFELTVDDLKDLAKRLKAACGAGGKQDAVAGTIEVQGSAADKMRSLLEAEGYQIR